MATVPSSTRSMPLPRPPSMGKKKANGGDSPSSCKSFMTSRSMSLRGERTVKKLRLVRALTVPESTSIKEACRRMAARKVDALLLTDSKTLLCGILTDKDIVTRVVAREINMEETPVSRVMTRNPVFVLADALAIEAMHKMVQGKFRHLPVVDNGEVIALLDITKCLYDAIARMERTAEKGKAIAAAVEGVEKQWGTSVMSGPNSFLETIREQMFRPSLSTMISENSKAVTVDPGETVLVATKKMLECRRSCVVVTVQNKPLGILTTNDLLMRVISQDLPPESTLVEKVMTPNPQCARIDSPIVEALHTMHNGRFLHLPVVDKDGMIVTVFDVLQIAHAAIATVGNTPGMSTEVANTMMQNFWDSAAMALGRDDGDETMSQSSVRAFSDGGETGRSFSQPSTTSNRFCFKIQDKKGRMHRFICDTLSLTELITAIIQRIGSEINPNNIPQILYEDEDNDKVLLASDSDIVAAVHHARLAGWKGLRLHLNYSGKVGRETPSAYAKTWASAYSTVAAGAALIAGFGVYAFLRRAGH